jgi:coiled-coil domain-containing protein 130
MSSLAAARADNFYYDPARFDPSKKGRGSANALAGSHPLGERAKRLASDGVLVVRFEMPHDVWCDGCGALIVRGIRFNADKSQEGAYFSTKIWRFEMRCTFGCGTTFVIRTDPANSDYEFVSGCRRKVREASSAAAAAETGDVAGLDETAKRALAPPSAGGNAFFKLEHDADDQRRARAEHARLAALAQVQADRYADDYASNRAARDVARGERREAADALAEGAARGLALPLLPPSHSDAAGARLMMLARQRALDAEGRDGLKRRRDDDGAAAAAFDVGGAAGTVLSGFVRGNVQTHMNRGLAPSEVAAAQAAAAVAAAAIGGSSAVGGSGGSKRIVAASSSFSSSSVVSRQARAALLSEPALPRAAPAPKPPPASAAAAAAAVDVSSLRLAGDPAAAKRAKLASAVPSFDGALSRGSGTAPRVRPVGTSGIGVAARPAAFKPTVSAALPVRPVLAAKAVVKR